MAQSRVRVPADRARRRRDGVLGRDRARGRGAGGAGTAAAPAGRIEYARVRRGDGSSLRCGAPGERFAFAVLVLSD